MTKAILELAKTISPKTIAACKERDIAAENEAKYGGGEQNAVNDISAVIATAGFPPNGTKRRLFPPAKQVR